MEISAKTGAYVQEVFMNAAKILYSEHKNYKSRLSRPDSFIKLNNEIDDNQDIIETEEVEDQTKKRCCSWWIKLK